MQVLGDQLAKRGASGEALRPMLSRTLADVQERLIFRCQAFIKEYVVAYAPSPQVRLHGMRVQLCVHASVCPCVHI